MNTKITNPLLVLMLGMIALIILLLLFLGVTKHYDKKLAIANAELINLTDTVRHYTSKANTYVAESKTIQLEKSSLLKQLSNKDNEIVELKRKQQELKADLLTVTAFTSKIEARKEVVTRVDTVNHHLTYNSCFHDDWINLETTSNQDSTEFNLEVKNDFVVTQTKKGLVTVETHNPYVTVGNIKSFQLTPLKQKHWGVGPSFGFGVGFSDKKFMFTPYIGVSIQYNVFLW